MRQYENEVQKIKHEVLEKISKYAFEDQLLNYLSKIPEEVNPGPDGRFRCCVYHERAVTTERIQLTLGGNGKKEEIVEVLDSACDHCPVERFVVTETCRGCLAHRCMNVCPKDAIEIRDNKAYIDQKLCIECGKCRSACPYDAISEVRRPCVRDCQSKAIKVDTNKKAVIDYDLCTHCGACVYNCPFGAIQDKSEILAVIEALKHKTVYAMLAPAFATQFQHANQEQVISAIKAVGFRDVIEVALGADLVVKHEAEELMHKKNSGQFMTTSCCPSFVKYIEIKYPELIPNISTTVSPMVATARIVKDIDPSGVTVFIGPCISKKYEKLKHEEVDHVLTFEELSALIAAKEIDIAEMEKSPLDNASSLGRGFAKASGVLKAIESYGKSQNLDFKGTAADGLDNCDKMLKLMQFNKFPSDILEGMACKGGCIKGPVTMHHGPLDEKAIESYANQAHETNIENAVKLFHVNLHTPQL